MKLDTLEALLTEELKDLYSVESQLVKALPKMAKKASSSSLKRAISSHLEETKQHLERLDQIAKILDVKLTGKTCKGMEGIIEEGSEILDLDEDGPLVDAAIISAAQRVEHYEIAAYGCARAFAERLGNLEVVDLLSETIDEEAVADEKLSEISEDELLARYESDADDEDEDDDLDDAEDSDEDTADDSDEIDDGGSRHIRRSLR